LCAVPVSGLVIAAIGLAVYVGIVAVEKPGRYIDLAASNTYTRSRTGVGVWSFLSDSEWIWSAFFVNTGWPKKNGPRVHFKW